jgi:hypothetical protein
MSNVRNEFHQDRLQALLRDPNGGLARDLLRRGIRVQSQARRNLSGGGGYPKRVDTGLVRSSIYVRPVTSGGLPATQIGTGVKYARYVHDGTGIYGPRGAPIRPRRPGGYLVFTPKGGRGKVFARQVRGMQPNPFLKNALSAAKD